MNRYEIVNKIIIENDCVFLSKAYSDVRPLDFLREEAADLSAVYRAAGLQVMLSAVLRRVYRGEMRLRGQSRITRALRESIHAFPMELIGRLDEDTVVCALSAAAEKLLADPDYDPAQELSALLQPAAEVDNTVQVKLLGRVELRNHRGRVEENPARQSLPWMLLKYLLAAPERPADLSELLREGVWPCSGAIEEEEGAARVRLRRLREYLAPLGMDGKQGLVVFSAGKYYLNPEITLRTDVDEVSALMGRLETSGESGEGLDLCREALELFRGTYMEHSGQLPWLEQQRAFYQRLFVALARETLRRSAALRRYDALALLCRRSAAIAPEDEALQREILAFLVEYRREKELVGHMARLVRSGKAEWIREDEIEQAEGLLS